MSGGGGQGEVGRGAGGTEELREDFNKSERTEEAEVEVEEEEDEARAGEK